MTETQATSTDPGTPDPGPRAAPGLFDAPQRPALTEVEAVAAGLSLLWAVISAAVLIWSPGAADAAVPAILTLSAVILPFAAIWIGAAAIRANRDLRAESARLHVAVDALRKAYLAQTQRGAVAGETGLTRRLDDIAGAVARSEAILMGVTQPDPAPPPPVAAPAPAPPAPSQTGGQAALELGTPAEALADRPAMADVIRALNFPDSAEDRDGIAALRRALQDRQTALLIRAAQDVLTLLSEDGVYVDDLRPDRPRPDLWRRFADGLRGRDIAGLGGIRDRASLALASGRMKQDPIFRDAAHHFLRRFDQTFTALARGASDAEIAALADTRTARAFMLLGRVTGTFD